MNRGRWCRRTGRRAADTTRYVNVAVCEFAQLSTAVARIVRRPSRDVEIRSRRRDGFCVSALLASLAVIVTEANWPLR